MSDFSSFISFCCAASVAYKEMANTVVVWNNFLYFTLSRSILKRLTRFVCICIAIMNNATVSYTNQLAKEKMLILNCNCLEHINTRSFNCHENELEIAFDVNFKQLLQWQKLDVFLWRWKLNWIEIMECRKKNYLKK